MPRTRRLGLAAAFAFALLPASAGAATLTTYEVVMEGRIVTDHRDMVGGPYFNTRIEGTADVAFTARIPKVQFLDGEPHGIAIPQVLSGGPLESVRPTTLEQRKWIECVDGCVRRDSTCAWAGLYNTPGRAIVQTRAQGADAVSVQTGIESGALIARMTCEGDLYGGGDQQLHLEPEGESVSTTFSVPKARIGDAVIEHPFHEDFNGGACPNRTAHTYSCSYDVSGTVTMRRTGQEQRADPKPTTPAPAPGGPPAPGPRPPAGGPTVPGGSAAPTVRPGRLKQGYSAYEVAIRCKRVGCRGSVKAYPKAKPARRRPGARGRASAAQRPLASVRFAAGSTDRVTARLSFDAADRRAIQRAGGIRLVVETKGAPAVARTVALVRR